jgi:hypothetical protein
MKNSLTIISLILLVSRSCYYSDPNTYTIDITLDYFPEIGISSNISEYDSISLSDSLLFKYEISIDTGRFYFTDLYMGSLQIFRSESDKDSLWIAPYYIEMPGDYTLTQISYFKSYSGSLADRLNSEYMAYDTSWTIIFYSDSIK